MYLAVLEQFLKGFC